MLVFLIALGVWLGLVLFWVTVRIEPRVVRWLRHPPGWVVETVQCSGVVVFMVAFFVVWATDPHFPERVVGFALFHGALGVLK